MRSSFVLVIAAAIVLTVLASSNPAARAAAGDTTRVSVPNLTDQGVLGTEANGGSHSSDISDDGRFVAFHSDATNLVVGDANGARDVFVHDRQTGETERVSVDSLGNEGNDKSEDPEISADGRFVAFESFASNLVAGDTNANYDIFVHDRQTGVTERVTIDSGGTEGNGQSLNPAISGDGTKVAFESQSSNLVAGDTNRDSDVFVHDRSSGVTVRASINPDGNQINDDSAEPSISTDGRFVAFEVWFDDRVIMIHDLQTSITSSLPAGGFCCGISDPSLDGSGRVVAYEWSPRDVYTRDTQTETREAVTGPQTQNINTGPNTSRNGRFVAFQSTPDGIAGIFGGLIPGDTNGVGDAYVWDRLMEVMRVASVDSTGAMVDGGSGSPSISGDAQAVAFGSSSPDLVAGDSNGISDIFVHEIDYPDTDGDGLDDGLDNCPYVANSIETNDLDSDDDTVPNACDLCPGTDPIKIVDVSGCAGLQVDGDGDSICNPGAPTDGPFGCTGSDNCPEVNNGNQWDADSDGLGDACDPGDTDGDSISDEVEYNCGSLAADALSTPERVDGIFAGQDEDSWGIDESLPWRASGYDCDGDGFTGDEEAYIFGGLTDRDQDPCGTDGWALEFDSGSPPDSANKINIRDLQTFVLPIRRFGTSPGDGDFDVRWDLVPGPGIFAEHINIADIQKMVFSFPPMFGGATRAFLGPVCPWAP